MEWISIKDRLPSYDKPVLVIRMEGWKKVGWIMRFVDKSDRYGLKWRDDQGGVEEYCNVSHWMELPKFPGKD